LTQSILNESIDSEGHRPEAAIGLQELQSSSALPLHQAPNPVAHGRAAPEIWVVLTHAVGDNDQCLALAEALGRPFRSIGLDWPASSRASERAQLMELLGEDLQGRVWRVSNGLHAPWPRMVICCGRRGDSLAFWIKRQSGGSTRIVTIGRARAALANYDLVVAPPQYMLPERANVIHLPISMARVRTEICPEATSALVMAPKPWFTLLLGGPVKQFVASESVLKEVALLAQLAADRYGGSVIVSTSRRTPPWLVAAVESELTAPTIYRWSGQNVDNPYATLLQRSAAVFVTADSMSMIRDACHSGAPTYLIELPERLDVQRLCRRGLYGLIRGTALSLRNSGLRRMAEMVDQAQDWLHAERILRYPRDLRRFHAKVYEMGMARPATDFDPSAIPARRDITHPLDATGVEVQGLDAPGVQVVVDRCMAWLIPNA
jgi:mitochondrial fission protein ELM1